MVQGKDHRPLSGTLDEIREDIGRYAEAEVCSPPTRNVG